MNSISIKIGPTVAILVVQGFGPESGGIFEVSPGKACVDGFVL